MKKRLVKNSEFIVVKDSKIHNKGVYAKRDIPRGTKIIEYGGEIISKSESEKRSERQLERNKNNSSDGAVYIFDLNKRYDLDGNMLWNKARLINHSCNPNAKAENDRGHIWIISTKNIKKDEEITYNYGYGFDSYKDHPCRCSSDNCVGYILAKKHWNKLKSKN